MKLYDESTLQQKLEVSTSDYSFHIAVSLPNENFLHSYFVFHPWYIFDKKRIELWKEQWKKCLKDSSTYSYMLNMRVCCVHIVLRVKLSTFIGQIARQFLTWFLMLSKSTTEVARPGLKTRTSTLSRAPFGNDVKNFLFVFLWDLHDDGSVVKLLYRIWTWHFLARVAFNSSELYVIAEIFRVLDIYGSKLATSLIC